ncbi:hypothetical protein VTH82DRAFT_3769 [Thermothelomyces myriococcoides]
MKILAPAGDTRAAYDDGAGLDGSWRGWEPWSRTRSLEILPQAGRCSRAPQDIDEARDSASAAGAPGRATFLLLWSGKNMLCSASSQLPSWTYTFFCSRTIRLGQE